MAMPRPALVAMDLEGVLIPEIWIAVAERTGIEGLRRTTRDEPDYDALMRFRLDLLAEYDLRIDAVREVIAGLDPLPGAREYVDWVRSETQLVILSDTYYQFAAPLMAKLGWPTLFCHDLEVDAEGRIVGYRLRIPDQKRASVEAFRALGFRTLAFGDSYNDLSMLRAADRGILFRPSAQVAAEHADLDVIDDHRAMRARVEAFLVG